MDVEKYTSEQMNLLKGRCVQVLHKDCSMRKISKSKYFRYHPEWVLGWKVSQHQGAVLTGRAGRFRISLHNTESSLWNGYNRKQTQKIHHSRSQKLWPQKRWIQKSINIGKIWMTRSIKIP
jgi:hypothetical protein